MELAHCTLVYCPMLKKFTNAFTYLPFIARFDDFVEVFRDGLFLYTFSSSDSRDIFKPCYNELQSILLIVCGYIDDMMQW